MNFKILEPVKGKPQLLIYRGINENQDASVTLYAIRADDCIETEEVLFDETVTAQRYVNDFSEVSAGLWLKEKGIIE